MLLSFVCVYKYVCLYVSYYVRIYVSTIDCMRVCMNALLNVRNYNLFCMFCIIVCLYECAYV